MLLPIDTIIRDFLALRGESPDLLPLLEEGEESAVLTLRRALEVRLAAAAVEATMQIDLFSLDELREVERPEVLAADGGRLTVRLPSDFLRLHTLRMADWKDAVHSVEQQGTLRQALGAAMPQWMACPEKPLVMLRRDTRGPYLSVRGSRATEALSLIFVPQPVLDGDTLTLSRAAYPLLLEILNRQL
ncbi:MAG: hypothetical protein J1F07_02050 [Muribaculaceae bacterium]|nr:hypothetical protein [Muribaculaceae bacterium]